MYLHYSSVMQRKALFREEEVQMAYGYSLLLKTQGKSLGLDFSYA
jgi:hypothetical protein